MTWSNSFSASGKCRIPGIVLAAILVSVAMLRGAYAAEQTVFWASDPVSPGQTVQVSGTGLASVDKIEVVRLEDLASGSQKSSALPAEILEKSENTLSFVLPAGFRPGVFSASLRSGSDQFSFQLNTPDVYWLQGDRGPAASSGGWLRVSGRNIATDEGAVAKLVAVDGKTTEIKAAAPDKWSATYPLPSPLPAGTYQVKLWNGAGDLSAWRDAGKIVVEAPMQPDRPVMELFSNQPDSPSNDDTARINASLLALSKRGGGTLLLHYGIYRLSDSLTVPDGVNLKGEGPGLVTLAWKDAETPPDSLIQGVRDFTLENLTIYAQRHFHIVKGGLDPVSGETVGQNITIRNVIVRASAFIGHLQKDQLRERLEPMQRYRRDGVVGLLLGGRNIRVEGCDILTSMRPIVLTRVTGAYVAGNTFHTGRLGWYGISAPDGVIFENNRLIGSDLQATGGGINTFDGPFARNVLIRNNRYETILGWDREAMTSDGPGGYYKGPVTATSANRIKMADPAGLGTQKDRKWEGAGLFVMQGRGLGLVARVVRHDGDSLELDRDIFRLVDETSIVSITPMQENYLVIGNSFTDAGAAQIFGTGYKHVFAENTTTRSYGLVATALNYRQAQPNFYIQFLNNTLSSAPMLRASEINVTGRQFEGNTSLLTLGIVIRGNRLQSDTAIRVDGRSSQFPGVRNVLIEDNTVEYNDIGIDIGRGVEDTVLRNNNFRNVRVPVKRAPSQ